MKPLPILYYDAYSDTHGVSWLAIRLSLAKAVLKSKEGPFGKMENFFQKGWSHCAEKKPEGDPLVSSIVSHVLRGIQVYFPELLATPGKMRLPQKVQQNYELVLK